MRQPFVAGNWKMNGSLDSIRELVGGITAGLSGSAKAEVAVCPSFVYLQHVNRLLEGSPIRLGAQNLAAEDPGAFTGEVAGPMLKDLGCTHVIVGHSERRAIYGETNELVARKFGKAIADGLIPILCVGEQLCDREGGRTEAVIAAQLDAVITANGISALRNAVVAYEPVWAIGTGKTASPEQAQDVHGFVRARLAAADAELAADLRLLYGGSVNAANAGALFSMADIDGGLIGGAALKPGDFLDICHAAG